MKTSDLNLSTNHLVLKENLQSQIKCNQGNKAPFVYINRNCTGPPFACEDKSCQCHQQHKKCIKAETATVIENLLQGDFSSEHISNILSDYIDSAIDQLSLINDRLLQEIKTQQNSYKYIGLSECQVNFVNNMKNAQIKNIKCGDIWEVLMSVKQEISAGEVLKIFENKVAKIWSKMETQIMDFGEKLMRELQLINRYKIQLFSNSRLIKTPQDEIKIMNFFQDKEIKSVKMLYRASQHDFEIEEFHKSCDHIQNTLTICQTEFNKVIGAFTPHEWYKNEKWQFFKDTSGESFVFSLTHGDKFVNENNEAGIVRRNDNTFGLQFGKNLEWDFLLANKANQNDRSLANINTGFKNKKYIKGDKVSFERFIGNPDGYTFKAKEWEVWKVQFKEKAKQKSLSGHSSTKALFKLNLDFQSQGDN